MRGWGEHFLCVSAISGSSSVQQLINSTWSHLQIPLQHFGVRGALQFFIVILQTTQADSVPNSALHGVGLL
jgi:hypothetical protein